MPPLALRFGANPLVMAIASIVPAMARARTFEHTVDRLPITGEAITAPPVMLAHKQRYLHTRAVDRDIAICTLTTRRAARRARGRAKAAARLASTRSIGGELPA